MAATPLIQDFELDFDSGSFDSAAFAAAALANWQILASVIDHTLLKPDATRDQVENLCDEAIRYRFACAMVNPVWASTAVNVLSGTGVPVGAVIGFPLGTSLVSTLRHEAAALIRLGVRELDMVIPIGLLKSGNHMAVQNTIQTVAAIAHDHKALLKVILETALLNVAEKLRGSEIAIQAGADFIKTSTGFASGGATPRRGWQPMRREGCGRHPHSGRRGGIAQSRRKPYRRIGLGSHSTGDGGGVRTCLTNRAWHLTSE
jgi:deoxyribose-phosphate aldolase